MPLAIPADHINVHLGYAATGDDQLAYTSIGAEGSLGLTLSQSVVLAQDIWDAWQQSMKGVTSPHWAMTGAKVTVGADDPPYLTVDLTGTTTGEGFDSALPNNCALLVSKLTPVPGRPGRGRMYVPGLDANSTFVSGRLTDIARGDWQDAIDEFIGLVALITNFAAAKLFHEVTSPITAPSTISALSVQTQIATQRRRMRP